MFLATEGAGVNPKPRGLADSEHPSPLHRRARPPCPRRRQRRAPAPRDSLRRMQPPRLSADDLGVGKSDTMGSSTGPPQVDRRARIESADRAAGLARTALARPRAPFRALPPRYIVVDTEWQRLTLVEGGKPVAEWPVSTA